MDKREAVEKIQKELFEMQDLAYRDFHKHLIPPVDEEKIHIPFDLELRC